MCRSLCADARSDAVALFGRRPYDGQYVARGEQLVECLLRFRFAVHECDPVEFALARDRRGKVDQPGLIRVRREAVQHDDVRAQIARLGGAIAAIERLAALLERDPGALLYGRGASTQSPLAPAKR